MSTLIQFFRRRTKSVIMSEKRKEIIELCAVRRATAVASGSVSQLMWDDSREADMAAKSREASELKSDLVETELKIRGMITYDMDPKEKADTLFDLFDDNKNGKFDINQIGEALRKIDDIPLIRELLPNALSTIDEYTVRTDMIQKRRFESFLNDLAKTMLSNYNEVCYLLVLKVIFADFGRERLQSFVSTLIENDFTFANMDRHVMDCRMRLLFDIMKIPEKPDQVDFKDVVKNLFHFAHQLDPVQREILFVLEENNSRTLTFTEFFEFVLSVFAALPSNTSFHDIANHMTLSARKQNVSDDDIKEVFLRYSDAITHDHAKMDAVASRKLDRLFDLWDLDGDKTLDFQEFSLGMRKFQEARDVGDSIDDIQKFWDAVDDNHDGSLDKDEFADLVLSFATAADVELHAFIDFMVVQTALRNNDEIEKAYIQGMKKLTEHQRTAHEGMSDTEDDDEDLEETDDGDEDERAEREAEEETNSPDGSEEKKTEPAQESRSLAFLRSRFGIGGGASLTDDDKRDETKENEEEEKVEEQVEETRKKKTAEEERRWRKMESNMAAYSTPTMGERAQNVGRNIASYFRRQPEQ